MYAGCGFAPPNHPPPSAVAAEFRCHCRGDSLLERLQQLSSSTLTDAEAPEHGALASLLGPALPDDETAIVDR